MAREMKDSGVKWIGEIPRMWSVSKIKFLIANGGNSLRVGPFGSSLSGNDFTNEGYWVYNQRSVIDNNFEDNDTFICENKYNELKGFRVFPHDILITTRGSIGKVAIVPDKHFEGILHPCIIRFVLNDEKYNKYFLKHIFNGTDIVQQQIKNKSNSTTIDVLYSATLKNLVVPLPPLPEQQTIADFLDAKCAEIDGLLADLDAEVKTLAEYKKSIIAETVTHGLNPNVTLVPTNLGWIDKIPEHWGLEKAKYAFELRRTKGNIKNLELLSPTQKYGVIPQSQLEGVVLVNEKTNLETFRTIHAGDFCISLRSFQGGFEYSTYEGVVSPAYQVFYPTIDVCDGYYKYMFKSDGFISKINTFSMSLRDGKNIAFSDFGNMYIPIPPIEEQVAIAVYLDEKCAEIEQSIADKQMQIETLKAYKASLIYEYVTGKRQVI